MIVQRFYNVKLAQASYLIGCGRTKTAVVIDPNRDVEQYVRGAAAEGVTITHVTETHIHADFVSGARELAERTGATLHLSDEGEMPWKYAYAAEANAVLVKDGDTFSVGDVRITVVHTPGHTPEHISFLVTDTAVADEPIAIVTGDFVFVGDVGRPDLLEKAAKVAGTMEDSARTLYRSLQRFKAYPDWLQIWPGHGAGSACGKGLSAVPHSTVGYERRFNWAFNAKSEDDFVRTVLAGQPEVPKYFAEMKRVNVAGPNVRHGTWSPEQLDAERLDALLSSETLVIDTRSTDAYAAGHIPGTLNIPRNKSFITWAGWLVPYNHNIVLIVDEPYESSVDEVIGDLSMIGIDRIVGVADSSVVHTWAKNSGRVLGIVPQISTAELADMAANDDMTIVDVRGDQEWNAGHLHHAKHIPLGYLADRLDEIPHEKPLVVHCQGGARSAIAASLLRAKGLGHAINMTGGFAAWEKAGYPVEQEPL